MESQLQIKHIGYQDDQPQFQVIRQSDMKVSDTIVLPSPTTFPVEGRPEHNLQNDLRWYLEKFLELPLGGYLHTAEQIQSALEHWGESCFNALFQGRSRDWFQDARRNGLKNLRIKIASEDPRILAWPWETLIDPEGGTLAHHCRIERQLNQMHDPLALPDNLPTDRINILLVIARPYGDSDVGFHALSRRMVELSRDQNVPVHIDVLRPPTFEQLRQTLYDKPGFYHIVHFDGHGGYGEAGHPVDSSDVFKGTQGMLIFEDDQGEPNEVEAAVLSTLMAEYQIPIMVLNACQSAMIDEQADDAFASVAASLLRAGIRSVVAMGYNLYVSGAQEFVPAFYQRLLRSGNVGEATRAGRQAMLAQAKRVCMLGEHELQDWLVPVLYQQDFPGEERVLPEPVTLTQEQRFVLPTGEESTDTLPDEVLRLGDYGLIGRGQAIHALEKALRQPAAGMLVHGMAGVGKTTLAKGFVHWLSDTGGLDETLPHSGVFWFGFDGIHSVEYVLNQILEPTYGLNALAAPLEQKYEAVLRALRDNWFLLIWDNFESVSGITGTEVSPLLGDDDRGMLKRLLADLQGGKTKVLITSRSPERWLNQVECYRLPPLDGLRGEEIWAYCNAVVSGLGLSVKRDDEDFKKLIEELDGNPLAIRAILLRLPDYSAKALLENLKEQFVGAEGDESTKRIMAALAVFDRDLREEWEPILQLIGLHQKVVRYNYLKGMLQQTIISFEEVVICLEVLQNSGVLHGLSGDTYKIHPAVHFYLQQKHPASTKIQNNYVEIMAIIADQVKQNNFLKQFEVFKENERNFHFALTLAKKNDDDSSIVALIQALAFFAQECFEFEEALGLFKELGGYALSRSDDDLLCIATYNVGTIYELKNENHLALDSYKAGITLTNNIEERSFFFHQIGLVNQKLENYQSAKFNYKKSLVFKRRNNDCKGFSMTMHQLASLEQSNSNEKQAEFFYEKALEIKKNRIRGSKIGQEHRIITL
uniref:TPR repeat:TPR repeat n=1 Tax=uncultured Thiotrichaceae bacterium TaxID=298394 RepID=A0A6S6T1V1_9GAMM|nr:MAG: TPR repeat:TPR repeat [uncultured Thiotrichaceae bacterium]